MSEQIVQCPGCSVKLKLKDDRVLPAEAACPKCNTPLFKKSKPASGPTVPSSGRSNPAAAPVRAAKPAPRRPAKEEFDEFEDEEVEDDFEEEVRPRKRSRSKRSSSGGIPGWAIGAGIGVLAVGVIVGVVLLLPKGEGDVVAQQPTSVTPATGTSAGDVATLPATGNANIPSAAVPVNTVAPATVPTAPVAGAGSLATYQPKLNSNHYYDFTITSDLDKFTEKSHGSCKLTARKADTSGFSIRRETQEGSGTGFVVGSNGVIVTCAHVVDNAETIEVVIGGQTYPASVLHSDSSLDLAVIKIEVNGLPVVPLANSDQIQLGQSLRVIGFPLSDLLGTGIKVTQGAVSGIVDQDGHRMIQTDATINPGNSGGPVFNTRGEVIGIASAKLAGGVISQVGFCVPSSTLSTMLQQQGIGLAPPVPGQEMDTPALVQKVTPAVAYIKVKVGPETQAQVAFSFTASLSTYRDAKGALITGLDLSTPAHESGNLSLTQFGKPVDLSEGNFAPVVMTRLPLLPFIELSRSSKTEWTNQRDISIVREEQSAGSSPLFRPRFGPFGRPSPETKVVSIQKAIERDQFRVSTNDTQQLVLNRTYELQTTDGSNPAIVLTGTGSWTFDRTEGMPIASDLKGTYKVTTSGITITIPYTMSVTRWSQEKMNEVERNTAAALANHAKNEERQKQGLPPEGSSATHLITAKSYCFKTLAMSPNGKAIAVTDLDKALSVYELATGKEIDSKAGLDDLGSPSASVYSPDGKFLLVGGYEGTIRIWAVDDEGELDSVADFVGHSDEIQTILVLPDNRTVLSCDNKKRVRAWSLDDQKEKYSIAELKQETIAIGLAADGTNGMLIARNSEVSLFNLATGKVTSSQPVFPIHYGTVALFSPDGKTLFIPKSQDITCHTVKSKKPPAVIDLGDSPNSIAYCPKSEELFVGGGGKIHVCDWKKERRTSLLKLDAQQFSQVKCVSVSPDGRYLAAIGGSIGKQVFIFDRQSPKSPATDDKAKPVDENPFQ